MIFSQNLSQYGLFKLLITINSPKPLQTLLIAAFVAIATASPAYYGYNSPKYTPSSYHIPKASYAIPRASYAAPRAAYSEPDYYVS